MRDEQSCNGVGNCGEHFMSLTAVEEWRLER